MGFVSLGMKKCRAWQSSSLALGGLLLGWTRPAQVELL